VEGEFFLRMREKDKEEEGEESLVEIPRGVRGFVLFFLFCFSIASVLPLPYLLPFLSRELVGVSCNQSVKSKRICMCGP
jgi:hypothetical protein